MVLFPNGEVLFLHHYYMQADNSSSPVPVLSAFHWIFSWKKRPSPYNLAYATSLMVNGYRHMIYQMLLLSIVRSGTKF